MATQENQEECDACTTAYTSGIATSSLPTHYSQLNVSKTIQLCNGCDIIRKSASRTTKSKSRYLLALPMHIIVKAGGVLGELTDMDTSKPHLYIDFSQGRLKLFGSIVHTSSRFMLLHCYPERAKRRRLHNSTEPAITCEDVFDKVVVFHKAQWVGDSSLNPDEAPETIPTDIIQKCLDPRRCLVGGAGKPVTVNKPNTEKVEVEVGETPLNDENIEAIETSSSPRHRRAASLRQNGKRKSYAEDEMINQSSSDSEDEILSTDSITSAEIHDIEVTRTT